jgi:Cu-Zn family superoxide dismutase
MVMAMLFAGTSSLALAQAPETMTADVMNAEGESVGTVTFAATPSGLVHVTAEFAGLPAGEHGFHVHEAGVCDASGGFESAGGHYSGGHDHGVMAEGGIHAGDFPNLHVPDSGTLTVEYFTDRISVGSDGENPLGDADGSAVIVHAGADDYTSQPAGDAGDRIACGVIE